MLVFVWEFWQMMALSWPPREETQINSLMKCLLQKKFTNYMSKCLTILVGRLKVSISVDPLRVIIGIGALFT